MRVSPRYISSAVHEESVLACNWTPIFSSFQFSSILVPGSGLVQPTRRCILFQTSGPRRLGSIQICHEASLDVALGSSELSLCRAGGSFPRSTFCPSCETEASLGPPCLRPAILLGSSLQQSHLAWPVSASFTWGYSRACGQKLRIRSSRPSITPSYPLGAQGISGFCKSFSEILSSQSLRQQKPSGAPATLAATRHQPCSVLTPLPMQSVTQHPHPHPPHPSPLPNTQQACESQLEASLE